MAPRAHFALLRAAVAAVAAAAVVAPAATAAPSRCDVLIAGGSTAALSAALTAAAAAPALAVCLTEPTDELGGQLAYNPAIDFGDTPSRPSREWASMVAAVSTKPTACRVSSACYPPRQLDSWVAAREAALPNLHVLLRTTVRGARRDATNGGVTGLQLVTRRFKVAAIADASAAPPPLAIWQAFQMDRGEGASRLTAPALAFSGRAGGGVGRAAIRLATRLVAPHSPPLPHPTPPHPATAARACTHLRTYG